MDFDTDKMKLDKEKRLAIIIAIGALILAFIVAAVIVFFPHKKPIPTPTPSPGPTPTPTPIPPNPPIPIPPVPLPCGTLPQNFQMNGLEQISQADCDQSGGCQYCYQLAEASFPLKVGFNGPWVNLFNNPNKLPEYVQPQPSNVCDASNCQSGLSTSCCNDNLAIAPGDNLTPAQITELCSAPNSLCYPCAFGLSPVPIGSVTVNGVNGTWYLCGGGV